jgi:Matrixin
MDGSRRSVLLAVAAAALLAAAPTSHAASPGPAQQWPVGGAAMQQARAIAVAHWGIDPCGGDVDVSWADLPADENADSVWTNPYQDYGDPKDNTLCSVTFNTRQDWDWGKLCTVFVHEFGHLAGYQHSADPGDVMFPYYIGTNVPACEAVSPAASQAPTAPRQGRQTPAAKRASRSKAYRAGTTRRQARPGSRTRRR